MDKASLSRPWWKRLPARLSVRALMILVLVLGVVLGRLIIPAQVQRDAVAVIKQAHGSVAYDRPWTRPGSAISPPKPSGPNWVRQYLGPDFIDTVTYVRLTGERCGDEAVRAACQLTSLEELEVTDTSVTDFGAEELARLTNLRSLDLRLNRISGRPLRHLGGMTELRELKLAMKSSPVPLKDEDLAFLSRLTKLESLMLPSKDLTDAWLANIEGATNMSQLQLYDMAITTEGLNHLKGLSNLSSLSLHGTRITSLEPLRPLTKISYLCVAYTPVDSSALAFLQHWPRLTTLDLRSTNVTDEGLIILSELPALVALDLSKTKVTDAGLMHLAGSKSLRSVEVRDTQVSDAGIAEFSKVNPLVKVTR